MVYQDGVNKLKGDGWEEVHQVEVLWFKLIKCCCRF